MTMLVTGVVAYSQFGAGDPGLAVSSDGPDFHYHLAVTPGGPAERAGLRTGDVVDPREVPPLTRMRLEGASRSGERLFVVAHRGTQIVHATVIPTPKNSSTWLLTSIAFFWTTAWGICLGLRRPDLREARILALLLCTLGWLGVSPSTVFSPWMGLDIAILAFSNIPASLAIGLVATYATLFGKPLTAIRLGLTYVAYAWLAITTMYWVFEPIGVWTATFDPFGPRLFNGGMLFVTITAPILLAMLCGVIGFRYARPAERTRLAWFLAPILAYYTLSVVSVYLWFVPVPAIPMYRPYVRLTYVILTFIIPAALTYSVLSRRLLDVGFALNRAVMFSVTTLLLAGLFAGGQWLADAALSGVAARNPFLQLGIAVLVFYIVRFSRGSAEGFISHLFFAARQRRITAVRELADAVDEVSDADAITAFVIETLRGQAGIEAGIVLDDGAGFTTVAGRITEGRLSENDPLLVRLRSLRKPIPAGDGVTAIPMILRKRLLGVFFARASERESELAPDEISALETLVLRTTIAREEMLAEQFRRGPRHRIAAV